MFPTWLCDRLSGIFEVEGVEAAVDALVGGVTQQDLPTGGEAHQGLRQTDHIPPVLHLPRHMVGLHTHSMLSCKSVPCADWITHV